MNHGAGDPGGINASPGAAPAPGLAWLHSGLKKSDAPGLVPNSSMPIPTRASVSPVWKGDITLTRFGTLSLGAPNPRGKQQRSSPVPWVSSALPASRAGPRTPDAPSLLRAPGTALPFKFRRCHYRSHSSLKNHIREIRAGGNFNRRHRPISFC